MNLLEWSMLIMLSILWGGSFFFVGVAVEQLPPLTIVSLRVTLASLALLTVLHFLREKLPTRKEVWKSFLGMSLLNNVIPFCLIVWGQTHIASGLASILNATTPLFTVLVAHIWTRDEKLTPLKGLGVLIGFIGVIIMIGYQSLTGLSETLYGQFAILGAAISYSFAGIYGRRFSKYGIKPIVTAAGQVTVSAATLVPITLLVEKPFTLPLPNFEVWATILGLALLSTALAYILYFRILATAGATNVVLVTLMVPVSATLLGITLLGEQLELKHLTGMTCISFGLLSIDGRLFRFIKRPKVKTTA